MAEISLREYHDKLEALLKADQVDETVHHCRHILQYFPRNVSTYRYLGRALLAGGNRAQAEEVFRRLLSVYPDDMTAHTSLAAIYRQAGQYDAAIWHLERAYEQDTSNTTYQQTLRELYRQHRGVDQSRLQLTAGAVARQHLNSGMHHQAVKTLHEALAAAPQRADLRLLLARALWDSGQLVESAEAALDTLEALPDCLEANQIMARFWLDEERPSDAQRYVSRIEALDPYAAYQIAQAGPPPDTAFTLFELDYGRVVKRRLATEVPDWLGDIDAAPEAEAEPLPAEAAASAEADLPDWLADDNSIGLDEMFGGYEQDAAPAETSFDFDDEAFPAFDDELPAADDQQPVAHTGFTGMLAALDRAAAAGEETSAAEPDSGELPDWLLASAPEEITGASAAPPAADAGAWFDEPAAEADETGGPPPSEAVGARPDPDADSLAWLYGSGVELADEDETPPAEAFAPDEGEMIYSDPGSADPLAWLQGSGVELADEDETPPAEAFAPDEGEMVYSDPGSADPLAWLYGSGVELADDALEQPGLVESPLADEGAGAAPAEPPPVAPVAASPYDEDDDAALDWLSDETLLDEMLDLEALADNPEVEAGPPGEAFPAGWAGMTDVLPGVQPEDNSVLDHESDWQTEMPDNDQQLPDWLQPEADEPEPPESAFAWLDEQPSNSEPAGADDERAPGDMAGEEPPAASMPEWLAASEPGADDEQFEWLSAEPDEPEAAEPASTAATPDWLAGAAQTSPLRAEMLDNLDDSPLADWPGGGEGEPEWLTQLAGGTEQEPGSEPETGAADSFDWIAGVEAGSEGAAEAVPDWLAGDAQASSLADLEGEAGAAASWAGSAEDEPEWLTQLAGDAEPAGAAEAEAEPVAADIPDWLAQAAPLAAAEAAFEAEEEAVADEDAFAWEAEAAPLTDMPEWLAEAAPPAGEAAAEAEPVAADIPEWLAGAAPLASVGAAFEAEEEAAADEDAFAWEAEAEPQADMPEWLAEAAPPAGEAAAEAEPAAADIPEWLAEAAPQASVGAAFEAEEEAAADEDAFAWEAEAAPLADMPVEEVEPADTAQLGELPEADVQPWDEGASEAIPLAERGIDAWEAEEEVAEAHAADESPEWLQAIAPAAASSLADAEPDYLFEPARSEFGWLEEISEGEPSASAEEALLAGEPAAAAEAPAVEQIDWLTTDEEEPAEPYAPAEAEPAAAEADWFTGEAEAEPVAAEEAFYEGEPAAPAYDETDWLASDDTEDAELERMYAAAHRPPPADNAPEWLNNMVPGLELDYEAQEDAPVESAFVEQPAPAAGRDFDWLNRIVDEETGPMMAVNVPAAVPRQPRFVFTRRQPAWLLTALAILEKSEPEAAPEPSEPDSGDDDFELPDWLR